ncbi:MAG: hypothetical protein FJX78_10050 [Armatimonadetes bacterium]|nr:hypothetical protein [Armatimonadota bacterium]
MAPRKNWIGIQIGVISFVDEGVHSVLDSLQERANVGALLISTPSWSRGNAGRGTDWFPEHGVAEPDNLQGGAYTTIHPKYYNNTIIKEFNAPDPAYQGYDVFANVIPEAKKRGMTVYANYCETAGNEIKPLWVPNIVHILERDAWGRTAARVCLNHPDYRAWVLSYYEDIIRSYPIDGICWGIERRSPLFNMAEGDVPTCFCPHCRRLAHERGVDVEAAIRGYEAFEAYFRNARAGHAPDGYFVEFMRLWFQHPAVMDWEKFWLDSHTSLYQEVYGTVKWLNPKLDVGLHIWQLIDTYHPFLRAQYDLKTLERCADWVKPVHYHDAAGFRFNRIVQSFTKTFLGDFTPQEATQFLYKILKLNEAPFDELPKAGFSAGYIRQRTEEMVRRYGGKVRVYPGLGVGVQGVGGPQNKQITPQSMREAVRASYEGGADGLLLSRNYSETKLENLAAIGQALRELGIGDTIPDGISQVKIESAGESAAAEGSDRVF